MVVQTASSTSGNPKARKTAFDPVWSFILSDYSDSEHDEEDGEYPPRQKRVHWGRLPTRFDPSDDEEATETRDDDDESNYLYMVPKYSASAASVLQSLLSFSDNEHEDEVDEEEVDDDDEARQDDSNLLGRLFQSGGQDNKSVAADSKQNTANVGNQNESKILSYLFPGRDDTTNEKGKAPSSKPEEPSFLKSFFSSDDENRGRVSRRERLGAANEEKRDGIVSRLSIWSWTSDEEEDSDSDSEDYCDEDDENERGGIRPLSVLRAAKRRFRSKKQERIQSRKANEDESEDDDTDVGETESTSSWIIPLPMFTTAIKDPSQKPPLEQDNQTRQDLDSNDAKEQRRLFPLRGRSLSDIAEENDGESLSSKRSGGSSTTERRLFSRRSSSFLQEDNDGGSVSSRRSLGSIDSGERRRLFLSVRKSLSPTTDDDNDASSVSSRRSGNSRDSRLFSSMRKSSSAVADGDDGGSVASRRSVTSKESAGSTRSVSSVRKSPTSLQKDLSSETISSKRPLPPSQERSKPVSTNANETGQQPKVIEGILRNSKSTTSTSSKTLVKQAKPIMSEKEEVHGGTRLSWKISAQSPYESEVEVERRVSARETTRLRRRSFLSNVKERKLLNWSRNRRRIKKDNPTADQEVGTVTARDAAPLDEERKRQVSLLKTTSPVLKEQESILEASSELPDKVESKSLGNLQVKSLEQPTAVKPSEHIVLRSSEILPTLASTTADSGGNDDEGPYDEIIDDEQEDVTAATESDNKVLWRFQAPDVEERELEPPSTICGVGGIGLNTSKALTLAETEQPSITSKEPFPHFQNLARNLVYFADALDLFAPFDVENPDDSETLTSGDDGSMASDFGDDGTLDGDGVQPFNCHPTHPSGSSLILPSAYVTREVSNERRGNGQDRLGNKSRSNAVVQKARTPLPSSLDFQPYAELEESRLNPSLPRPKQVVNEIRLTFQPDRDEQINDTLLLVPETSFIPPAAEPTRRIADAATLHRGSVDTTAAEIALLSRSDGTTEDELDEQLVQAYVLSIEECSLTDQPWVKSVVESQAEAAAAASFLAPHTEDASHLRDLDNSNDPRSPFTPNTTERPDMRSLRSVGHVSSNTLNPTEQIHLGLVITKSVFPSATTEGSDVWSFDEKTNKGTNPFQIALTEDSASNDPWSKATTNDSSLSNKQVEWQWPDLDDGVWHWPGQDDEYQRESVKSNETKFDEHEFLGDIHEFVVQSVSSDEFNYFPASSSICSRLTDDLTAAETVDGSAEKADDISHIKQRRSPAPRAFLRKIGRRSPKPRQLEASSDNLSKIVCCSSSRSRDSSLLGRDTSRSEDVSVSFPANRFVSDSDSNGHQTPSKVANVITVSDFINGTLEDALLGPQMLYTYEYESKQHMDVVYDQYGANALELLRVRSHRRPPSLSYGSNEALIQVEASTVSMTDCEIRAGKRWGSKLVTLPTVPGVDFVGRIRQVGKTFSTRLGLSVGDRVISLTKSGGNSRYVLAPDDRLVKVPENVDPAEAAALAETYLAAFQVLHIGQNGSPRYTKASLQGKAILIIGVVSNVGRATIELAKAGGATALYGTCKQKHFKTLQDLGVVPLVQETSKWTGLLKGRVDLILVVGDRVKEDVTSKHLEVLRAGGRIVFIGRRSENDLALSSVDELESNKFVCARNKGKSNIVMCYDVYHQWERFTDRSKADLSHLLSLLQQHLLEPHVLDRLPLRKVVKAHELLESKRLSGILVCEPWLKSKQRAMYL